MKNVTGKEHPVKCECSASLKPCVVSTSNDLITDTALNRCNRRTTTTILDIDGQYLLR